jgi:pimeloyl-ACP methyl ester carboxylesterase
MHLPRPRRFGRTSGLLALACIALIVLSGYRIQAQNRGIAREQISVDGTPVEIFRPSGGESEPAVVVAHGFSGSRQIMYAFGYTLAHNGYLAALLDFPGHGRNSTPMASQGHTRDVTQLTDALSRVVDYVRTRDDVIPNQVAVLGHSMGTGVVITYGKEHPDAGATIALSAIMTDVTPSLPPNLLLLTGALEFGNLKQAAQEALRNGGGDKAGVLYGDFADGTARRLEFVPRTEHVSILFSRQALAQCVDWLNAAFGHGSSGWTGTAIGWVLVLYAAALGLYFPLSKWAWSKPARLTGHRIRVRDLLVYAGIPALVTPLVLRVLSPLTNLIPVMIADYLMAYFFLAGMGTLLLMRRRGLLERRVWARWIRAGGIGAGLVLFGYIVLAVFIPSDLTWASMVPTGARLIWFFVLAVFCFPYFLADTALTYAVGRGTTAGRFLLTKALFAGSLLLAVQITPGLFFILLLLPFLMVAWSMFGVYAARALERLGTPVPGAMAISLAFAWFMASLFPLA